MRDINDLKDAFGQADDSFKDNVYLTLASLRKSEERKPMRKLSLRLAAAIAVFCLLATGTALAMSNAFGILDFLRGRRIDVEVLPEAAGIIQKDVPQEGGQSALVNFAVREAVYDEQHIYIVVEAKPSRPEYLLLGADAQPSDPASNLGPLFANQAVTIAEYAQQNNKELLHAYVYDTGAEQGAPMAYSYDFILEEDGTLVYMINMAPAGSVAEMSIEFICAVTPFKGDTLDIDNRQSSTLSCILTASGTKGTLSSTSPVIYADCGVRVDKVTLTGSPMAIYAEIKFTVLDEDKFAETDGGLWFEFLDENGERLPSGAATTSSVTADDSEKHFVQKDSLRAMEALPSEITLRGYNCWEKNRYETHTFQMK